jgi:Plasmid pRiA4b ORF-3-like protein
MPSTKPSRAVTAVERKVLLKCGHQAGLVDAETVGMAQDWGRCSTVAPYRLLTFATQVHRSGPVVHSSRAGTQETAGKLHYPGRKPAICQHFLQRPSRGLLTPRRWSSPTILICAVTVLGVTGRDQDPNELQRRFEEIIAGMDLEDLEELAGKLLSLPSRIPTTPEPRPSLRKPRRSKPAILRVRVDLKYAKPPIWRRLDVRSDIGLDVFHQVLQSAFGWTDSHLHRFALGGSPFDRNSELFLCPYDVEEGEDDGTPAEDVTLDETLSEPGDVLQYCYDYGDSWDLIIALESVLPLEESAPVAVCINGRRAAPPEDCGGLRDAADLAEVLADPARFDLDEINEGLNQ